MELQAQYVIDRFEDNGWAVLERDDGQTFNVPLEWLPEGAQEGHVLSLVIEPQPQTARLRFDIDRETTERRVEEARGLRESLPKGPRGNIDL